MGVAGADIVQGKAGRGEEGHQNHQRVEDPAANLLEILGHSLDHLGKGQDRHMEAAQSGMEHFGILRAGHEAVAGTKGRDLAGNFDRNLAGWDLDVHLEGTGARSWSFLDAGHSDIRIAGSEEGGLAFLAGETQTCMNVGGFHRYLP